MKNLKTIFGIILVIGGFIGILVCIIASYVFMFRNPDMTTMRRFLEYPWPTVWAVVDFVAAEIGVHILKNSRG